MIELNNKEEEKALKELKKLKVYRICSHDPLSDTTFSDIYFKVLHEVDMHEEHEEESELTRQSYKSAKNWLNKYHHLFNG